MKEYIMPDGAAVTIKSFEEWLHDRIHMTEAEFLAELGKSRAYYHYKQEYPEEVIKYYRREYGRYVDRIHLDHIPLTFSEYLESYEGHTPSTFHEMCDATGVSKTEETKWLAWIKRKWQEHENNLTPF